jgi:hypothetical protein
LQKTQITAFVRVTLLGRPVDDDISGKLADVRMGFSFDRIGIQFLIRKRTDPSQNSNAILRGGEEEADIYDDRASVPFISKGTIFNRLTESGTAVSAHRRRPRDSSQTEKTDGTKTDDLQRPGT